MKSSKLTSLILFVCSILIGELLICQNNQSLEAKIDAYVQPYLDMNAWSGVILISKNGSPIFHRAYGLADREWGVKNTLDTKFRIASVSKVFTEVAILKLAESGSVSLDDKLTAYIPDYPKGNEITIRHLLEHRSGIPHLNSFSNYSELIKFDYEIDEIIDLFKNKPLDFTPGERYSYSNSGYVLLAYIIQEVSGSSYAQYLEDEIFEKTGLRNTGVDRNELILEKRARGYMFDNDVNLVNSEYVNMSIKIGGGSLYSTAEDLNLFIDRLLDKRILSSTLNELPNFGEIEGQQVFTANGRVQGFCHQLTHRLGEDLTIIVLGNHYSNIAQPISDDLYRIYSGQTYNIPVDYFAREVSVSRKVLKQYVGTYDFGFGPIGKVRVTDSGLTYLPPGRDTPDRLIPLGENSFFYPQSWVILKFKKMEKNTFSTLEWIMGENAYPAKRIGD